jgi:hypothetical protein
MRLTRAFSMVRIAAKKKKRRVNPWAICNSLPEGTSDEKFERCVQKIKHPSTSKEK